MKKIIKKLGRNNGIVKPMSVITESILPLGYLLKQSTFFVTEDVSGEFIMVTKEFMTSFQGALIVLMLAISIVHVYKPSKAIIFSVLIGGLMMFASALFHILGITLLLYGVGLLFNNFTLVKTIARNDRLAKALIDREVDDIIKETKK